MDPSSATLFRSSHPHQSVATVFLVENSQEMSVIWTDLRDKYLNGLVNTLVQANPSVPVTVSVLESYAPQSPGSNTSFPRQYLNCHDALQNVNFNFSPSNKITTSRINTCIDFLDTAKYQGQPAATHLIIVAATTPIDDTNGMAYTGNTYTSWVHLSQKLKTKNIQCHLVVSPQHDMGSLTFLFEETLRIQGNVEEFFYPPSESSPIIMRLSSKPNYELQNDIRATTASYPPARASVPRRNSYPLDNFYSENFQEGSGPPTNGDVEQPTSLVSQLQQVHGLTKKKVYGAKPIRQPFFRDERTRERYQQTPPLTMSMPIMDPNPSPTGGGRTMSQSRADRIGRLSQASPTDHPGARRQHGWPRRGSRLSTPEADGYGWPSSPSVLHDTSPGSSYMSSSPVTPVTSFDEVYQHPVQPPCVPSMGPSGISPGMAAYQNGGIAEGAWDPTQIPRQVGSYNPAIQTYFPPAASHFYTDSGHITTNPEMLPPRPSAQSTPGANVHMQQPTSGTQPPPPSQPPVSTPPRASTTKKVTSEPDDDDERFTFQEDFVAATAALFEAEVLPAYPNYPGMSSGLFTNNRVEQGSQSLLSSQAGELYATRHKQNPPPQAPPPPPAAASGGNLFNNNNNPHINFAPPPPPPQAQFTRTHSHVPMANMIGSQPSAYSYGVPAHAANYGSSLTGWAG